MKTPNLLLGFSDQGQQCMLLNRANRHGIIAGATGTGKTVTLMTMAIRFAHAGVPVFVPDVKGDLAQIATMAPTKFWDLSGERGSPIRVSIKDIGANLLSRLLEANDTQDGVLTILFKDAEDNGLDIITLRDVRRGLNDLLNRSDEIAENYGHVDARTVSTIQRKLLKLEMTGADKFFGPTTFSLKDLITSQNGLGTINVLRAEELIHNPTVYATFLFWLLNEMFRAMPEVGDPEKPKLVFFCDEAHLLFDDAPKPFVQTVERVVRLIRSKGVGVYFVTQSPADLPDAILAQLGNRVQHALRAYTPTEQKGLRAAAMSFRTNPDFDTADAIQDLGVGEALVSMLDGDGRPQIVQRTKIAAIEVQPRAPKVVVERKRDHAPLTFSPITDEIKTTDLPFVPSPPFQRKAKARARFSIPLFFFAIVGWTAVLPYVNYF